MIPGRGPGPGADLLAPTARRTLRRHIDRPECLADRRGARDSRGGGAHRGGSVEGDLRRELLELYLDRIERLDRGHVNAVVTLDVDRARDAAASADAVLARSDVVGPLHGLPITIKDAIETEGIRSTGGAVELADHVPAADAPAVARLKAAGAIVFGKTNLPRWCGDSQAFNELFGTTNNPWSLAHVPGGSSGGSAAALAAGLTGAELGTDIGGSVRAPAHCCGVVRASSRATASPTSATSTASADRPRHACSGRARAAVAHRAPGRDLARRRGLPGRRRVPGDAARRCRRCWRMPARRSRTPIPQSASGRRSTCTCG